MTRDNAEELFDHSITAWTAGELRNALDGVPDHMPVCVTVADDPGGQLAGDEQVVIDAGVWTTEGLPPSATALPDCFAICCEFPSGQYYRPQR